MFDHQNLTLEDASNILKERSDLKPSRQRDMLSALTRISKAAGKPMHDIPTDAPALRGILAALHPQQMGITAKSFSTLKSATKAALQASGAIPEDDPKTDLTPEWQAYSDGCETKPQRYSLVRFMRFCDQRGHGPQDVEDSVLQDFRDYLDHRVLAKDPDALIKEIAQTWNGLNRRRGLGLTDLTIPKAVRYNARPLSDYPASLIDDLESHLTRQQVTDIFDDSGPTQPIKDITARNIRQHVRQYLDALHQSGVALEDMVNLKAVVTPDLMKQAFRQIMTRLGVDPGDPIPPTLHNIGASLKAIAKHHLQSDLAALAEIDAIRKKVAHNPKGMSDKNKARLDQFDDWRNVALIVGLPRKLMAQAEADAPTRANALDAMYAVLIAILLSAPMRIKNAAGLRLDHHVLARREGRKTFYSIRIPDHEVKNNEPIEVNLSKQTSALITEYLETYRPLLSHHAGDGLFPRASDGAARMPSNLSQALAEKIKRETGLTLNAHFFRHFAAFLFLSQRPGEYETVRRLLGHKTLQTTMDFYAEMTSKAAHDRYDAEVLQKFGGAKR